MDATFLRLLAPQITRLQTSIAENPPPKWDRKLGSQARSHSVTPATPDS